MTPRDRVRLKASASRVRRQRRIQGESNHERTTMIRIAVWVCFASWLLVSQNLGAAQTPDRDPEIAHSYKMTIASKLTMDADGKKQKIDGDTEIRYTWKAKGLQRTLFYD